MYSNIACLLEIRPRAATWSQATHHNANAADFPDFSFFKESPFEPCVQTHTWRKGSENFVKSAKGCAPSLPWFYV
eukprot:s699_g33.t1